MIVFIAGKNEKLSKSCLSNVAGLSYNVLMRLVKNKDVKINGQRVSKDILLCAGDKVELYYNEPKKELFSIIYKDDNVVVVNKKKGYTSEAVFESVKEQFSSACFIHRLDRNTDGVMIFSLNGIAETELSEGFKNHTFKKEYLTEVYGKMDKKEDVLTAYLQKDSDNGVVKIFDKPAPDSVFIKTGYKVIEEKEKTSLLQVRLYTGKTHQIRAHLAHIGHFVVGDGKYGNNKFNKDNGYNIQRLSSNKLTLVFSEESPLFYLNGKEFKI